MKVGRNAPSGLRTEVGILRAMPPAFVAALMVAAWASVGAAQMSAPEPTLRYTIDSAHREIVVELSPLNLPAHATHHDIAQLPPQALVIPVTGWFEGYSGEVVDSAGRPIPADGDTSPQFDRAATSRALQHDHAADGRSRSRNGTGEHAGRVWPSRVGLPCPTRGYAAHYHHAEQPDRGDVPRCASPCAFAVRTPRCVAAPHFDLSLLRRRDPARRATRLRPATRTFREELGGSSSGTGPNPGGRWTLHQYGVQLRFEDVTTGRILWQTAPIIDGAGHVIGFPTKSFAGVSECRYSLTTRIG